MDGRGHARLGRHLRRPGGFPAPTATGGLYDPGADRRRAIPIDGAPSERVGHTAVRTGTEMIVWGGLEGSAAAPVDTGGRLVP